MFDAGRVLLNVTATIVLLQLPNTILLYFCTMCLGHLSRIYTRIIYEPIDFVDQIGGMGMRMLARSCAFSQLQERGIITKAKFGQQFAQALQFKLKKNAGDSAPLDDTELLLLCKVAYEAVANPPKGENVELGACSDSLVIDIDSFMQSNTNNEIISLRMLLGCLMLIVTSIRWSVFSNRIRCGMQLSTRGSLSTRVATARMVQIIWPQLESHSNLFQPLDVFGR